MWREKDLKMDNTKDVKYVLFDKSMYYKEISEYMRNKGDMKKNFIMENKYDTIVDIIKALNLYDEYQYFVKTGEIK